MLSFWETQSFLQYDTIVIGGGIVGLSTAISLKEKLPHQSVLVLERGLFPTGASTRNAGFACFGSLTELLHDLQQCGPAKTLVTVEKRIRGLARLRQRLSDAAMDYQPVGGYELLFESALPALDQLEGVNDMLRSLFPGGVFTENQSLVKRFGFHARQVRTIVQNPYEGHVHTGKMMKVLEQLAREKGVEVRTGATVEAIEEGPLVKVWVSDPARGKVPFVAHRLAVTTNAFTSALLPGVPITPARGQVLVTSPIADLPCEGTFHFEEGYYYFRNVGDRVLFGGGRNLAFDQETTTRLETNPVILYELERLLREVILPGRSYQIEQYWSGIMGFSPDKQPIVERVSPQVVIGFTCNGMGVSLASTVADEVVQLLLE